MCLRPIEQSSAFLQCINDKVELKGVFRHLNLELVLKFVEFAMCDVTCAYLSRHGCTLLGL